MATALYRRYRPDSFADMIGQGQVTGPLMTALRTGRVNHAYLFSGPRGCGKTSSARILARCLNCAEGPTDTPCGVCDSCRELARDGGGSLDVVEIDAASHGGVDDARDLRDRAILAPQRDRFKVFIIDEAHMVSAAGFNALLKVVEEPPEHVRFVFATTEPEKVIGTIRSRTHHFPFRLIPPALMLEYVEKLCGEEGVRAEPGVLPLVVRAGGGSARDTLSLLDQIIGGSEGELLEYERAAALLGFTSSELLDGIVAAFAAQDAAAAYRAIDRVIQSGQDPRRFVEDLLERYRDLIVVAATGESAGQVLRGVSADEIDRLRGEARGFTPSGLAGTADLIDATLTEMSGVTSPRLHLELLVARILVALRARFAGADGDGDGRAAAIAAAPASPSTSAPAAASAASGQPAPAAMPGSESRAPERMGDEAATAAPASLRDPRSGGPGEARASTSARGSAPASAPAATSLGVPAEAPRGAGSGSGGSDSASSGSASAAAAAKASFLTGSASVSASGPAAGSGSASATPTAGPSSPRPASPSTAPAEQSASPQDDAVREPREGAATDDPAATEASAGPAAHGEPATAPRGEGDDPSVAAAPAPREPSSVTEQQFQHAWPSILDHVRQHGRLQAWTVVMNVRPLEFRDGVFGFEVQNRTMLEEFKQHGADHVRAAVTELLGIPVKFRPRVVDREAAPGGRGPRPEADAEAGDRGRGGGRGEGGADDSGRPNRASRPAHTGRTSASEAPSGPRPSWNVVAVPGSEGPADDGPGSAWDEAATAAATEAAGPAGSGGTAPAAPAAATAKSAGPAGPARPGEAAAASADAAASAHPAPEAPRSALAGMPSDDDAPEIIAAREAADRDALATPEPFDPTVPAPGDAKIAAERGRELPAPASDAEHVEDVPPPVDEPDVEESEPEPRPRSAPGRGASSDPSDGQPADRSAARSEWPAPAATSASAPAAAPARPAAPAPAPVTGWAVATPGGAAPAAGTTTADPAHGATSASASSPASVSSAMSAPGGTDSAAGPSSAAADRDASDVSAQRPDPASRTASTSGTAGEAGRDARGSAPAAPSSAAVPAPANAPAPAPAPASGSGSASVRASAPGSASAAPASAPASDRPERYGESVIREQLGARFVDEEPIAPPPEAAEEDEFGTPPDDDGYGAPPPEEY